MSKTLGVSDFEEDEGASRLKRAFDSIVEFQANGLAALNFKADQIESSAADEISGKHIFFDEHGFTAGMRRAVVRPVLDINSQWNDLRNKFNVALQPYRSRLDAVDQLGGKISEIRAKGEEKIAAVDDYANISLAHKTAFEEYKKAKAKYDGIYEEEGGRQPTVYANHWYYWIALFCIGVAEWLINYNIFMKFMGIPAIAAGTTIIIGMLLAFAAHAHGTILKQWNDLFSDAVEAKRKISPWQLLTLSTSSALLVFGFAGATRYSVALDFLQSFAQPTISLGGPIIQPPSPLGEVGISLFANIAAWAVGVFIAYFCHDRLQSYMDADKHLKKTEAIYQKHRLAYEKEKRVIANKTEEDERKETTRSNFHFKSVADFKAMESQVRGHDEAFKMHLIERGAGAARAYLDDLIVLARKSGGGIEFSNSDGPLDVVAVQKIVPDFRKVAALSGQGE